MCGLRTRKLWIFVLALIVAVSLLAVGCGNKQAAKEPAKEPAKEAQTPTPAPAKADKYQLRIGSSGLGTTVQIILSAIGVVVNEKEKSLKADVIVTGGSVENPRLMKEGKLEMGGSASAYLAFTGKKPFEADGAIKMSYVLPIYTATYFFVTKEGSGINNLSDLAGKKVGLDDPGGAVPEMAKLILGAAGVLDKAKVSYASHEDTMDQLKSGVIDAAATYSASTNPPFLENAMRVMKMQRVEMDPAILQKVINENPQYYAYMIPKGFMNMKGMDKDFPVIGLAQGIFARDDLPEDVVYKFTKAVYENVKTIKQFTAVANQMDVKTAVAASPGVMPIHPGAARYYKEVGAWVEGKKITGQ